MVGPLHLLDVKRPPRAAVNKPPLTAPSEAPDGGTVAWLQVVGHFFLNFNSWGLINSYGSFQTYYATELIAHESASAISWIGSIQTCITMLSGIVAGRLVDAGYFRPLVIFGCAMSMFGMMMVSLCTKYWQLVLAQGIITGIGSGFIYTPGTAVVTTWFSGQRSLAIGISAAGSSLAGVVYPIMLRNLFTSIGFPWATRAMAFVMLSTNMIAIVLMRSRLPPRKMGPLIDFDAFKYIPWTLFVSGLVIDFLGLWTPFFFIGDYALHKHVDANMAFYLLSIMNASSAFGRIVPNFFADKIGPLNSIIPCCICASILIFAWTGIESLAGLVVFAILYGFVSGAMVSLPPTVVAALSPDLSRVGVRLGMTFALSSIGMLCGPPVSGAIISRGAGNNFKDAFLYAGIATLAGSAVKIAARISKTGLHLKART